MDEGKAWEAAAGRCIDRKTLLLGAAGALAAAGLGRPADVAADGTSDSPSSASRFDPVLARRLQRVLRDALRDPATHAPGAVLHVRSPSLGAWTGVAGLGRIAPETLMRRGDRFRAGSIAKVLVAAVVLQLAERGRIALEARLPEVLPAEVVRRFPTAADVTVRMLLGHRAGIPEWTSPTVDRQIARRPETVWTVAEILDLAAAQPPVFSPGTGFSYSNTGYTLLGLVIERATGRSWRGEVTRRVIRPLRLTRTSLPAPGHRWIEGAHARGYAQVGGRIVDMTRVDPSMAGAGGGGALVTTVQDLARFLDALLAGRLFRRHQTLRQMLAMSPAQDEGGLVGYGLGIERHVLPGGVELIGHLGGTAGYRSYVGRLRRHGVTIALMLNWQDDPTPLVLPAVEVLTTAGG